MTDNVKDFADIEIVRAYMTNLSETTPPPGNDLQNFLTRRNDLFFDLLHQIATASGVEIDRHELDRLAYVPFGWQTEQDELKAFRTAMLAVLEGRKPIVVAPIPDQKQIQQPPNPYPPPPA